MKVLLGHTTYQWPGGEDTAFELDERLLLEHGHEVVRFQRDNREIASYGLGERAGLAARTVWNPASGRDLSALLARERPDIAHFHNTFPLMSPSVFAACHRYGIPVVVTMANYRLGCLNAFLFRDGGVCEDCLHRTVKWPGVLHACYRGSRPQSAVVASMLTVHRLAGTWRRSVDAYIAVSEFGRDKLVEAGAPAERVFTRHNFVHPDPGAPPPGPDGAYALFVGRLSAEKGLGVMLDAFETLPAVPLKVVGDGPERSAVAARVAANGLRHVEMLGLQPREQVLELMRAARLLVVPSIWYEQFPFVMVEALACGLPIVASDLGALAEIVDGAGRAFPAGDGEELARTIRGAWNRPEEVAAWRHRARLRFEERYTAERAYDRLVEIYEAARATVGRR